MYQALLEKHYTFLFNLPTTLMDSFYCYLHGICGDKEPGFGWIKNVPRANTLKLAERGLETEW